MKQKYTIVKNDETNTMTISEHAELDKEMMSLLCEETFPSDVIGKAVEEKGNLVDILRTRNMYPPVSYANRIAKAVIELYKSERLSTDLYFDDIDFLTKEQRKEVEPVEEVESEAEDIDGLLDDEIEGDFGDDPLNTISTTIKVADDESLDIEDDT